MKWREEGGLPVWIPSNDSIRVANRNSSGYYEENYSSDNNSEDDFKVKENKFKKKSRDARRNWKLY